MKQPFRNQKLGKIVSRTIKNRPKMTYPDRKAATERRAPAKKP